MDTFIKTPEVGEILIEEFMKPLGLSAYKLANDIHVPVSRIQDIMHNRRRISADTSLRLAKYFGLSASYFLDIQNDIDLRKARNNIHAEIEEIIPYKKTVSV
ncbi:MAG: HigA family addiction module antidote protein [Lachnospiraceae bacterium]|nr:HigA family addiction module antidote protein [Lachnospiraceae bacterium]